MAALQNPYMDTMTAGAQSANQSSQVANSMMSNVQKSMQSSSDLAFKMTKLLKDEQARKFEQAMKTQQAIEQQYQFDVNKQVQDARTGIMQQNANTNAGQLTLGQDKLALDKYKTGTDIFKVTGGKNADGTSSSSISKIYKTGIEALKAEGEQWKNLSDGQYGRNNMTREEGIKDVANRLKVFNQEYNPISGTKRGQLGVASTGMTEDKRAYLNKLAGSAGMPQIGEQTGGTPTNLGGTGTPTGTPPIPSTLNMEAVTTYLMDNHKMTPEQFMNLPEEEKVAIREEMINAHTPAQGGTLADEGIVNTPQMNSVDGTGIDVYATGSGVMGYNPMGLLGVNAPDTGANVPGIDIYQPALLDSRVTNTASESEGFYNQNVLPIIEGYKKDKINDWEQSVMKDPRVMNYFVSALNSSDNNAVLAAQGFIDDMNIPRQAKKVFENKITARSTRRYKGSSFYNNRVGEGGTIEADLPKGDSTMSKRIRDNFNNMNISLSPNNIDMFRQFSIDGSEAGDAMSWIGSKLGLTDSAYDDNVKISSMMKRVDTLMFKEYGVNIMGVAADGLRNVSEQVFGDDTQPWKFGLGIMGYSGANERIQQTVTAYTPTGTKEVEIHQFMVPKVAGAELPDAFKVSSGDRGSKKKYNAYQRMVENQISLGGEMGHNYKKNMFRISADMKQAMEDEGYNQDGAMKLDVDTKINTQLYNFHTGKLEDVTLTYEQASVMLGAGMAPVVKGTLLEGAEIRNTK